MRGNPPNAMDNDVVTRRYAPTDMSACLAIFDSNVPKFFAPEERAEFQQFLKDAKAAGSPCLVLTCNGAAVACGGLMVGPEERCAVLAWGMVQKTLHGKGLGRLLTTARLEMTRETPGIDRLRLGTSQHTWGLYEKLGFTVTTITKNGFAPGLDRVDMTLRLR